MERNDSDLRQLLREWKAPQTPASLESRVLPPRQNWWRVLLHGYIRIPVPVACCLAILMAGAAWRLATNPTGGCSAAQAVAPAIERISKPLTPTADRKTCGAGSTC